MQRLAAMKDAGALVAFYKERDAFIFQIADIGLVGYVVAMLRNAQ